MIKRLRMAKGWSQAKLAAQTCLAAGMNVDALTRQDVYRWEKGKRTPREWLPFIAAALEVPPAEMQIAATAIAEDSAPVTVADFLPEDPLQSLSFRQGRRIGSHDVMDLAGGEHAFRLTDDVSAGQEYEITPVPRAETGKVGKDAVKALMDVLSAQRRLDDALGSAALLTPTLAQLESVRSLAGSAQGEVGKKLCGVTAEWMTFTGWLHASLRRDREAMALFAEAEELADEAGDPVTAALAMSFRGYVARQRENWPGVVRASIAARESPGAHYTQRVFDTLQAAQGYAGLSKVTESHRYSEEARRLLGQASDMIEDMTGDRAEPPPAVYWYNQSFFRMNLGMAYYDLGYAAEAVENLTAGFSGLPEEHRKTEWAQEYRDVLRRATETA